MDTDSPPLRKPWYRPRNIILAVIALVLGWLGWAIYYSFSAEPGRSIDHARLLSELVEEYMPGEPGDGDAWPLLLEAIAREEHARGQVWADREDWRGVPMFYSDLGSKPSTFADDGTPTFDDTRTWADAQARLREAQRVLREQGVFDLFARLTAEKRAVRPIKPDARGRLSLMLIPELSNMRNFARIQRDRMFIAAENSDWTDLAAAHEQTLALARIAASQGTLIDYLVGVAIEGFAQGNLSVALVESPPTDPQVIRTILAGMDRQTQPPIELALRGERIFIGDAIQRLHTDNGRGSGRLLYAEYQLETKGIGAGGGPPSGLLEQLSVSKLANVAGFAFASKAQTISKADEYFDGLVRLARAPITDRGPSVFDTARFDQSLSKRYVMLQESIPAGMLTLRSEELVRLRRAGTRALLHAELFRIKHARPPESLDELAPGTAPEALIDPLTGKRFGYRKLAAPDQFGRTYLLYSVGADGEDNGGKPNIQLDVASLQPGKAPGTDFVFNEPREYPEPPVESDPAVESASDVDSEPADEPSAAPSPPPR